VRRFILTDRERRLLERWIEDEEEDQQTRIVLSWVRRNWSTLADDMTLMFETIRVMMRRKRWRGRMTGRSEFGSALRRAESALTRVRRGAAT